MLDILCIFHCLSLKIYYEDCLGYFYVTLTQCWGIWAEGLSVEKTPPLDVTVGKSVVYFLNYWLMWENPGYWHQCKPWAGSPGSYKKVILGSHGTKASTQHYFMASASIPVFRSLPCLSSCLDVCPSVCQCWSVTQKWETENYPFFHTLLLVTVIVIVTAIETPGQWINSKTCCRASCLPFPKQN